MAVIHGTSWGATPNTLGDAGGIVTWSIAPAGLDIGAFPSGPGRSVNPASIMSIDYQAEIAEAFDEWSEYGNIEFIQIADSNAADIRIFFGPVPGATAGYAFFPSASTDPMVGDVLLDSTLNYNADPHQLHELAIHEIGHSLGLDHVPQSTASVMTPTLSHEHLQADDINGIRQIYGPQDNRPAYYNMASGQKNFSMLSSTENIVITGNALSNTIRGADKNDVILAGDGFDTIYGGLGNDLLRGEDKADRLHGGAGNDNLEGGQGFDILYGDHGNDVMNSGHDADRLYGGAGNDLMYAGSNFSITVDGVFGQDGNDTMYGQAGFDYLDGGNGNDFMDGGHQADNLYGRNGNDTMRGDLGLDRLFGGNGNDRGFGGEGDDGLFGDNGNDTLYGENGNDRLFGGAGDDHLDGGAGNDVFYGGAGFDTIIGGTGNDTMQGNFNADTFVFANGHGRDVIQDFDEFNSKERVDLKAVSSITNFADLSANHMSQVGGNVVINTGGGNSITLNGVNISDLGADDFLF